MKRKIISYGVVSLVLLALVQPAPCAVGAPQGQSFASAQEAVSAFQRAVADKDFAAMRTIFGPGISNLINPDLVMATNELAAVASAISESNRLVNVSPGRMVFEYGRDAIPFPVPIVQASGKWAFDTAAGTEELINRRIGRNELAVLEAIRTYVEAQREYASYDRDDDEVLEYAQKFASTPGTKDGLYWPIDLDGSMSPLGPLVAEAQMEGYRKKTEQREPFHGYFFRILTRQGKRAPGGDYDYIINGNMIGGFALVAWPAEYGSTGVMTFIVNQQGRVYQKDLGDRTEKEAAGMKAYNPDSTWAPSKD